MFYALLDRGIQIVPSDVGLFHALNTLGLFGSEFFLQSDKHASSHLQDQPYQPITPAVEASPSLDKLSKKS